LKGIYSFELNLYLNSTTKQKAKTNPQYFINKQKKWIDQLLYKEQQKYAFKTFKDSLKKPDSELVNHQVVRYSRYNLDQF
jgi:hypothetical protein